MSVRTLKLEALTRVEGEGSLNLRVKGGTLKSVELRIFEPPRFFEALLLGRDFREVPDITARICGICPIAYQVSSCTALEAALGIQIPESIRALRRLIYCGEWIKSHALHIHLLHAPDFLHFDDAVAMAAHYPDEVKRGLRIKKAGNRIMEVLGGRAIHPISLCVGGFTAVPSLDALLELRQTLVLALEDAIETAKWVGSFEFPDIEPKTVFVAMRHSTEYPMFEGRLASSKGLDIGLDQFDTQFTERQVPYSTALHYLLTIGKSYQVGPIARYNLNRTLLTPAAKHLARDLGLGIGVKNPFKSIVVRAVETVFALEEAIRIISEYEEPDEPRVIAEPRPGEGFGCSEAPRGICHHTYRLDDEGKVVFARIIPPTSQNLERIEQDLREWVPRHLGSSDLALQSERAIRNYDPCISCSTHFLNLTVEQEG